VIALIIFFSQLGKVLRIRQIEEEMQLTNQGGRFFTRPDLRGKIDEFDLRIYQTRVELDRMSAIYSHFSLTARESQNFSFVLQADVNQCFDNFFPKDITHHEKIKDLIINDEKFDAHWVIMTLDETELLQFLTPENKEIIESWRMQDKMIPVELSAHSYVPVKEETSKIVPMALKFDGNTLELQIRESAPDAKYCQKITNDLQHLMNALFS
jgi:hypothetical protein